MLLYIISLINILMLNSCNQKAEPETYLLPKGFTGRVNIILNQKEGSPIKYEDKRRVYEIPADGILLTQFTINDGFIDRKYYYVDSVGNRTNVPIYKYDHNDDGTIKWQIKDSNEVGVFLDGTSGQYGNPPNAVWWQEVIICSYNNKDSFFTPQSKKEFEGKLTKKLGFDVYVR